MAYRVGDTVRVKDKMQRDYSYAIAEPEGENFAPDFKPAISPKEMLRLGVFEGKYCNDCGDEFPEDWFAEARISRVANPELNFFKIKSRQPLSVWRQNRWIVEPDPRGWFQWYCRYYLGRRLPKVDAWQIKRWKAFYRHVGQIKANCMPMDIGCRPRQRQALLQWAYDPFV